MLRQSGVSSIHPSINLVIRSSIHLSSRAAAILPQPSSRSRFRIDLVQAPCLRDHLYYNNKNHKQKKVTNVSILEGATKTQGKPGVEPQYKRNTHRRRATNVPSRSKRKFFLRGISLLGIERKNINERLEAEVTSKAFPDAYALYRVLVHRVGLAGPQPPKIFDLVDLLHQQIVETVVDLEDGGFGGGPVLCCGIGQ